MLKTSRASRTSVALAVALAAVVLYGGYFAQPLFAQTTTYCPSANPYDNIPDTLALQDCVDNYDLVILESEGGPGYVGYILDDKLRIRNFGRTHGPVIISTGPAKAVLIATPDLAAQMIDVDAETSGWEFHQLKVDGNRYNRTRLNDCGNLYGGYNFWASNMLLKGHGFSVVGVESARALCGTGAEVAGDNYTIWNSSFYDNGTEVRYAPPGTAPWADGLTLLRCDNAYVHDNTFYDNTDVDLVVAGGNGCGVARNSISHTYKEGIAGINAGSQGGTLLGNVWSNSIYSDEGLLRAGLVIGMHPWDATLTSSDVGEIFQNNIDGTVINLAIDGILNGNIHDNTLSRNRGSNGLGNCSSYAYTAGHFGSATIQPGYTSLVFDGGYCHTP